MSGQQAKSVKFYSLQEVGRPDPKGGLRITMMPGIPGAWNQAIRYCTDYLNLDFKKVRHPVYGQQSQDLLYELTAQRSVPTVIYNDERPRNSWLEQINLLQRLSDEKTNKCTYLCFYSHKNLLAGTKRLIPLDPQDRMTMIGYLFELAGEQGLQYNNRLIRTDDEAFLSKYPGDRSKARGKIQEGMKLLSDLLEKQKNIGSRYFVGKVPSALDFFWTAMSVPFSIPDYKYVPISEPIRQFYEQPKGQEIPVPKILIEHRDYMLQEHIPTPVELGRLDD